MTAGTLQTDSWETLPWREIEKDVYRLQKRIYQASRSGDKEKVHKLQRLVLGSRSAKTLAVRTVTQDNAGKKTAGVDGIKSLTPRQRLKLTVTLGEKRKPDSVRRVYIPKANGEERPLGIPTMRDRALQALVKIALEPEWEARFEPNAYGFRPGRSAHDAVEAIFSKCRYKANFVLDADIEKCFDQIEHGKLLAKLDTIPVIEKLVRGWLEAGIIDQGETMFPEAGTPQGGVISPLLANIALHGLEQAVTKGFTRPGNAAMVVRYADDFVIMHHDLGVIELLRARAEAFLQAMGLRLKPSKTTITHTLTPYEGKVGFDFLGFTVRQFPQGKHQSGKNPAGVSLGFKTLIKPSDEAVKRHLHEIKRILVSHRNASRDVVVTKLRGLVRGWTRYYRTVASRKTFEHVQDQTFRKLLRWAQRRNKGSRTAMVEKNFQNWKLKGDDGRVLSLHTATPVTRHIKVKGDKSPYDGDWAYWAARVGRNPLISVRTATLLKRQKGKCNFCALLFTSSDTTEVHHRDRSWANNRYTNLDLFHKHCHDQEHARCQ